MKHSKEFLGSEPPSSFYKVRNLDSYLRVRNLDSCASTKTAPRVRVRAHHMRACAWHPRICARGID